MLPPANLKRKETKLVTSNKKSKTAPLNNDDNKTLFQTETWICSDNKEIPCTKKGGTLHRAGCLLDESKLHAFFGCHYSFFPYFPPSKKKRQRLKRERAVLATNKCTVFRFICLLVLVHIICLLLYYTWGLFHSYLSLRHEGHLWDVPFHTFNKNKQN